MCSHCPTNDQNYQPRIAIDTMCATARTRSGTQQPAPHPRPAATEQLCHISVSTSVHNATGTSATTRSLISSPSASNNIAILPASSINAPDAASTSSVISNQTSNTLGTPEVLTPIFNTLNETLQQQLPPLPQSTAIHTSAWLNSPHLLATTPSATSIITWPLDASPSILGGALHLHTTQFNGQITTHGLPIVDQDHLACAICLEMYKEGEDMVVLPCGATAGEGLDGHRFHLGWVQRHFEERFDCPLCRCGFLWRLGRA